MRYLHPYSLSTISFWVKRAVLWIWVACFAGGSFGQVNLTLRGDRLSLDAKNADLNEILQAFAAYGIDVQIDANYLILMDVHMENEDLDTALRSILGDINYSTLWRDYQIGEGKIRVLEAIRVVGKSLPGGALLRVQAPLPRVQILPDGTRVRANELILGLRPGTRPEAFRALLDSMGAHIIDSDPGIGVYRIRLPEGSVLPDLLERLARETAIAAVEPNHLWAAPAPVSTPGNVAPPSARNAPASGSPALAIFDSGLSADYADASFVRSSFDATGNGDSSDSAGHGTQMALLGSGRVSPLGLPLGDSNNAVISIRSMESDGLTSTFGILKGLTHANEQGARVVSMSWGAYNRSGFLDQAFAQAADKNILLLAAAGNDGRPELMYPASSRYVLAVGALNAQGELWEKGNTGKELALLVSGVADLPVGYQGPAGRYAGTSIATATAAGILTQLATKHPKATTEDLLKLLQTHTALSTLPGTEGARVLDAAALKSLLGH